MNLIFLRCIFKKNNQLFSMESKITGRGGKRPGAGRPKGKPNQLTIKIKETILKAYEAKGGKKYLMKVADEDPRTFCMLLAKILPSEMIVDTTHTGNITFEMVYQEPKK